MNGDNSMPYLDGTNPYLVNYVQVNDLAAAQERSWQLRYDYDFKAIGLNGLTFLTRYVNGTHIKVPGLGCSVNIQGTRLAREEAHEINEDLTDADTANPARFCYRSAPQPVQQSSPSLRSAHD